MPNSRTATSDPRCHHCGADFSGMKDLERHECPVPTAAPGGHTKVTYVETAYGIVEICQPVNAIVSE